MWSELAARDVGSAFLKTYVTNLEHVQMCQRICCFWYSFQCIFQERAGGERNFPWAEGPDEGIEQQRIANFLTIVLEIKHGQAAREWKDSLNLKSKEAQFETYPLQQVRCDRCAHFKAAKVL